MGQKHSDRWQAYLTSLQHECRSKAGAAHLDFPNHAIPKRDCTELSYESACRSGATGHHPALLPDMQDLQDCRLPCEALHRLLDKQALKL